MSIYISLITLGIKLDETSSITKITTDASNIEISNGAGQPLKRTDFNKT